VIHEGAHQAEAVALSPEARGLPAAVILHLDDQICPAASGPEVDQPRGGCVRVCDGIAQSFPNGHLELLGALPADPELIGQPDDGPANLVKRRWICAKADVQQDRLERPEGLPQRPKAGTVARLVPTTV